MNPEKSGGRSEPIESTSNSQIRLEIRQPVVTSVNAQRLGFGPKRGETLQGYLIGHTFKRLAFVTALQLLEQLR